jgi:hypothetical protein
MLLDSIYRCAKSSWPKGLAVAAAIVACPSAASAQVQQAYHQGGSPVAGSPVQNANYHQGGSGEFMTAYGDSVVVPAGFHQPLHGMGGGYAQPCDPYGGGYPDPSLDLYGMPNYGADQCGPHYFDFSVEALYWARVDTAEPDLPFAVQGIGGNTVLSTDNLSFDEEAGVRLVGRYDIGPVSMIEIGYSGLYEWNDRVEYQSTAFDLLSPFSDFGEDPNFPGGQGLDQTDGANFASLEYWSELHNADISYRHYWVGWSPRVTGSWLAGFRYTRLAEDFVYGTITAGGSHQSTVQTENDLTGFQAGGDMWVTVRQGIRIGAQGKAGLYNNRAEQNTRIQTFNGLIPDDDITEVAKGDRLAFLTEGNLSVVADITPSISIRAGYDVLFINTVALAPNNFNASPSVFSGTPRTAILIEESSVLYHGANLGFEYVW